MSFEVITIPGWATFKVQTNDTIIGKTIRDGNIWEKEMHQYFEKYIVDDTVALDIGANIGTHSVAISKLKPSCQVHSFEPMEFQYYLLKENIKLNSIDNVQTYKVGLGATEGSMYEPNINWADEHNFGGQGLVYEKDSNKKVDIISLDSMIDTWTKPISFIKCDVEGFEMKVLEGAMETIRKYKPVLIIEIWDHIYSDEFLGSWQAKALEDMGYSHEKITHMDYLFT